MPLHHGQVARSSLREGNGGVPHGYGSVICLIQRITPMKEVTTIGLDLAKSVFQVHGVP